MKFQFRSEVSNAFNLTNLGQPTRGVSSANFGKITGSSTYFPNRRINSEHESSSKEKIMEET